VALRAAGSGHLVRSTAEATFLPNGDNSLESASNFVVIDGSAPAGPPPASPFFGYPLEIPGRVEAEDFDTGGEGSAYHDADTENAGGSYRTLDGVDIEPNGEGGLGVGWTGAGEWMQYTVNVLTGGAYTLSSRVARGSGGTAAFHIEANGVNLTGSISIGSTGGWQQWAEISRNVTLSPGEQTIRIVIERDAVNFDYIEFSAVDFTPPAPTLTTERIGSNLIFSWPATAIGKDLLTFDTLESPIVWTNLNIPATQIGQKKRVVVPVSKSSHFFQLGSRINEPPTFRWAEMWWGVATAGQEYSGNIAGVATDPDGDPISFTAIGAPAWLSIASNGDLSGTPTEADIGWYKFTLNCSADGGSDTSTINLQVKPPADPD
jgi:hypothetical protein